MELNSDKLFTTTILRNLRIYVGTQEYFLDLFDFTKEYVEFSK